MRVRLALGGGRGIVIPESTWQTCQYCYDLGATDNLAQTARQHETFYPKAIIAADTLFEKACCRRGNGLQANKYGHLQQGAGNSEHLRGFPGGPRRTPSPVCRFQRTEAGR
jgi:hypothetical protein